MWTEIIFTLIGVLLAYLYSKFTSTWVNADSKTDNQLLIKFRQLIDNLKDLNNKRLEYDIEIIEKLRQSIKGDVDPKIKESLKMSIRNSKYDEEYKKKIEAKLDVIFDSPNPAIDKVEEQVESDGEESPSSEIEEVNKQPGDEMKVFSSIMSGIFQNLSKDKKELVIGRMSENKDTIKNSIQLVAKMFDPSADINETDKIDGLLDHMLSNNLMEESLQNKEESKELSKEDLDILKEMEDITKEEGPKIEEVKESEQVEAVCEDPK